MSKENYIMINQLSDMQNMRFWQVMETLGGFDDE